MKKIIFTLFIFSVYFAGCQEIEFNGTFSTTPDKPIANEKITVKYLPTDTKLADAKEINMIVYQYNNDIISSDEINMTKKEQGWIADFTPSKIASGSIVVFNSGDITDNNNGAGYLILLNEKKKKTEILFRRHLLGKMLHSRNGEHGIWI